MFIAYLYMQTQQTELAKQDGGQIQDGHRQTDIDMY